MNNWLAILGLLSTEVPQQADLEQSSIVDEQSQVSGPILAWRVDATPDQINSTSVEYSAPAIFQDKVFIGLSHKTGLHIFHREHGYFMGVLPTESFVQSPPTIIGDRLYVADLAGNVYAWNVQTQELIWEVDLGIPVNSKIIVEQELFVSTNEDVLYALNDEGEVLWRYAHRVNPSRKNNMQLFGGGTPLIRDEDVLVGFSDGALVQLQRDNGTVLEQMWNGAGRFPDIIAQPVMVDGSVMVASFEQSTWKQEGSNIIWEKEVGGLHSGLLIEDSRGARYAHPGADGHLRVMDAMTGNIIWDWDSQESATLTQPQLWNGHLLLSSSTGGVFLVDVEKGETIWKMQSEFNSSGSMHGPIVSEKDIFILTKAGFLEKYQILTEQQWTCPDPWCSWIE